MTQEFCNRGYKLVPFLEEKADWVVVNTCTVTQKAEASGRNVIRKAHRFNPNAKIIVVGCYAEMAKEEIEQLEGVHLVLGSSNKHKIFEYLDENECIDAEIPPGFSSEADYHTRGFLKVQDGCNNYCSYCIIAHARGEPKSIPLEELLKHAEEMLQNGIREIVLTGVNIGEYKSIYQGQEIDFAQLVKHLLLLPFERFRISSIEPNTVTRELLSSLKDSQKACAHFHIPLQSGSDRILELMERRYARDEFLQSIALVREFFPDAAIGTDVIVGFPGETEADYQESRSLIEEANISHLHVFSYSKRKGTKAFHMTDHLSNKIKEKRSCDLRQLGDIRLHQFMRLRLGKETSVLFETCSNSMAQGLDPYFCKVRLATDRELKNQIVQVKLNEIVGDSFVASLL